jgi:uncharacterized phage protein gp47/JayE
MGASTSLQISQLAKMGFLRSAEGSFLDALGQSHYGITRNAAVAAVFDVSMINASGSTYSPAAGDLILRSSDGQTYTNVAGATITNNATTVVSFVAQEPGSAGNVLAQTLQMVTPLAGVTAVFAGAFTTAGNEQETDDKYRARCAARWGALRVEKVRAGVLSLAVEAAPSVHGVSVDDDNPRGAGTVDIYVSGATATAGSSDVALVQAALDDAFFGNGAVEPLVQASAAPTQSVPLAATVYVRGLTSTGAVAALTAAWRAFLLTVPVGGFDLTPGPTAIIQSEQIAAALARVSGVVSVDVTAPAGDVAVSPHFKVLESTIAFSVVVLPSA